MSSPTAITENDQFHGIKEDYDIRSLTRAIQEKRISEEDADIITRFVEVAAVTRGTGMKRSQKIVFTLVSWRRFIGPFLDNSYTDIYRGIEHIKKGKSLRGRPFTTNTLRDHFTILKQFYRWLIKENLSSIPLDKITDIKTPRRESTKTVKDLLSPEEIKSLIDACQTSRDHALICVLYEGGFRAGEIGKMRWEHLLFDGTGVAVNVNFKTGKPRYIRLVLSKEYLIKLKSEYTGKGLEPAGDNHVFVNQYGEPLTYAAIQRQVERLCSRAGINRHINLHVFRHSRITHLVQQGVSESVIKYMMWGSVKTDQFETYAHLTGGDVDNAINRLYGIETPAAQIHGNHLEPKICSHCHEPNSPISRHCHLCGQALDKESTLTDEQWKQFIMDHAAEMQEYLNTIILSHGIVPTG